MDGVHTAAMGKDVPIITPGYVECFTVPVGTTVKIHNVTAITPKYVIHMEDG